MLNHKYISLFARKRGASSRCSNMEGTDILVVVLLLLINITFMVLGMLLNFVVILSLWRASTLRKKLCYFMILVLSCYDMAVVTVTRPFLIVSTIYFCLEKINRNLEIIRLGISFILSACSASALVTLNVERFLALTHPFFHQAYVTKTKVICFQGFCMVFLLCLLPLFHFNSRVINIFITVLVSLSLLLFMYSNYKMFTIAKLKREDKRIYPAGGISRNEQRKIKILNMKNISTCSLVVGCFFVCFTPQAIFGLIRLITETALFDKKMVLFSFWTTTFSSLNSTFNSGIFFWRNSILRREGMKIMNTFRPHSMKLTKYSCPRSARQKRWILICCC